MTSNESKIILQIQVESIQQEKSSVIKAFLTIFQLSSVSTIVKGFSY